MSSMLVPTYPLRRNSSVAASRITPALWSRPSRRLGLAAVRAISSMALWYLTVQYWRPSPLAGEEAEGRRGGRSEGRPVRKTAVSKPPPPTPPAGGGRPEWQSRFSDRLQPSAGQLRVLGLQLLRAAVVG